jgi:hypothetical protein
MDTTITINKEDLDTIKPKIEKARIIALHFMNQHPLTPTSNLTTSQKKELISKIKHIILCYTDEERNNQFNEIVNEKILNLNCDYTKYPIYVNRKDKKQLEDYEKAEDEINKLTEKLEELKKLELKI